MKIKYFRFSLFSILAAALFMVSCQDKWDSYFDETAADKSNLNLYQYIQSRSDLTKFDKMLKLTGFDSVLTQNVTYTVWAPVDSVLADVNMADTTGLHRLVETYVTRFSNTTQGITPSEGKTMQVINGKLIPFTKKSESYYFGGKHVTKTDIATRNGILHLMDEQKPFVKNIWEYIKETSGLDSLRKYINSRSITQLDKAKSYDNGVLVDSIFKTTNYVMDTLAAIHKEDSFYTAILPDNSAWKELYARIYPYYVTLPSKGGVAKQREFTQSVLVNDLFFRGRMSTPVGIDSLVSTGGTKFKNPDRLFEGATKEELSNGNAYIQSQMKNVATDSWFTPIRIEADWSIYGRLTSNYSVTTVSSLGTGYSLYRNNYALFTPTTVSSVSKLYATFPIPFTLSAKYNIYCVFVPSIVNDTTDKKPYAVQFYLTYTDANGNTITESAVDASNNLIGPKKTGATFKTDPKAVQKMLVLKNFTFPYSNISLSTVSDIKVALKVLNAAPVSDVTLSRSLKIDYILLEPVL